ncbi:hypothetical protein [Cohnella sp. OV330]|uniref:hypothetical protein n=1 Tax=Cohnella sp. OV330 TaxID=1855288 RepID=UPI001160B23A|nr:hypothetical protein [Cohnella sp. OV330]
MFFFFFQDELSIKPGSVCEVKIGLKQGNKVIVSQVRDGTAWAHDAVPARRRVNRSGRNVIEFDPACAMSPYNVRDLRTLEGMEREAVVAPLRSSYEGSWSEKYVKERGSRNAE